MIKNINKLRFESKINRLPKGGCWIWTGGKTEKGYGMIRIEGKRYRAHRVAYELYVGEIPDGMLCCHSCDTPSCCNPAHLFLGSNADNQRDKISKGRHHCSNGYVVSDENRAKISELHKGNTYNLGRVLSDEHKAKLSASHKGKKLSEEHKAKIGASGIGRKVSNETRAKIAASLMGHKNNLGVKFSDETKAKMSKSATKREAAKRETVRKASKSVDDINK